MAFFISKPVKIEAMQFTGGNFNEIYAWALEKNRDIGKILFESRESATMAVHTPEGVMTAINTDWIIFGTMGEFYPCKNEVFQRKYQPA